MKILFFNYVDFTIALVLHMSLNSNQIKINGEVESAECATWNPISLEFGFMNKISEKYEYFKTISLI